MTDGGNSVVSNDNLATLISRIRWYRNRLAAMSAGEVLHRMAEQLRRAVSRIYLPRQVAVGPQRLPGWPTWPGLAEGVGRLASDTELLRVWADHVEDVSAGRYRFLGVDWPVAEDLDDRPGAFAPPPDWHLDPVTGRKWPSDTYCFDIGYRHTDQFGDIKNVWELSRLQYLQPVAAFAAVAEDDRAAQICVDHLVSWIEDNPPFKGVHWSSGIELARRLVSMLMIVALVGNRFSEGQRQQVLTSITQHAYWLYRYPSRYSSANNHLVAEAAGLFLVGALLPDMDRAERYRAYGRRVLEQEVGNQIHDDGVGAEQSPAYAALTIEWFLICGQVAGELGMPFDQAYWNRIGRAGEFLNWVTDCQGNQPRIGDDDDSRVIANGMQPEPTINSVLGCIAAATGRAELSPPVLTGHLRNALFGTPAPWAMWPNGVRHFHIGGYTAARMPETGLDVPSHLLVFDHGPVGYLSISAHGHADALSVWLHIAGRPVLIDAGTYLYHAGHDWRDHFRGTVAHNTLTIAGENSSEISGPFNWGSKAETRILDYSEDEHGWLVEAEHDGYSASRGVSHRRRVEQMGPGHYRITDMLVGRAGAERVEVGFLVAPEFGVVADQNGFLIRGQERTWLQIRHDNGLAGWVETGRTEPERGWHSPSFGVRQPTPRIVFAGEIQVGAAIHFDLIMGNLPDGGVLG